VDVTGDRPANPGRLIELRVADEPDAWAAAGFAVEDGVVPLGNVAIHPTGVPASGPRGITGWSLTGVAVADGSLDGLATVIGGTAAAERATPAASHPNGATGIDHVVVATPDLERTIAACEHAGLVLRRIREVPGGASSLRQAFFKLGDVVLEVVSGAEPSGQTVEEAPATFFGLAVDVADLDATARLLGDGLGAVRPAVQRGRRIGTLRHRRFDLSVAIAAMDDHAERTGTERTGADRTTAEGAR
jgi:hypothetical protein